MKVTDSDVVELPGERKREAFDLFMSAIHMQPTEKRWRTMHPLYASGRTIGVLDDGAVSGLPGELLGTITSVDARMRVPGGARVPVAAGFASGVRADRTRRGILTAMMRREIYRCAEDGAVLSVVRPSEGGIYGRFGYGCATRTQILHVDGFRVRVADSAPGSGRVRLLTTVEAGYERLAELIPPIYRRAGLSRPGAFDRPQAWWSCWGPFAERDHPPEVAVHEGPDGPDGYAMWVVVYEGEDVASVRRILHLAELCAADGVVEAALWRFVLELDLVEEIRARDRPLDDVLPLLLTDRRACRTVDVLDEAWIRLVDVPAALGARSWASFGAVEPVVIELRDDILLGNSGGYRITPDGVERTGTEPDLRCDVNALSTLYLGDASPSQLSAAGRLEVRDRAVLRRADALFGVAGAPHFGAFF